MAVPNTVDDYVELTRKSELVPAAALDEYIQKQRRARTLPIDPKALAGFMVRDGLLTYFQAEHLLLGKWKRFRIGNYKVLGVLGHGDGGMVYLCEHLHMRKQVALKVLPTGLAENPVAIERFYHEARACASLQHPHVVQAIDIDRDDNLHFLVMEHIDGIDLSALIRKTGPLAVPRACHYIWQAAQGLEYIHGAGLVHRSICPQNLVVHRTGVVKIVDFGLVLFTQERSQTLGQGYSEEVLGIPDYMAPEQCLDSQSADARSDIYALGCTFYFLLSGSAPFIEGTTAQKLIWHQSRHPTPILKIRSEVTEKVVAILDRMMDKRPEARYQTPQEVCEALALLIPVRTPPPPEWPATPIQF